MDALQNSQFTTGQWSPVTHTVHFPQIYQTCPNCGYCPHCGRSGWTILTSPPINSSPGPNLKFSGTFPKEPKVAFTEELYKNKGKYYGAHTGKAYDASDVEEIGGQAWSKPCYVAPNSISLKLEYDKGDMPVEPHEKYEKDSY
jgi:hypothetical protein